MRKQLKQENESGVKIHEIKHEKEKEMIPKLEHGSEGWLILGLKDEIEKR